MWLKKQEQNTAWVNGACLAGVEPDSLAALNGFAIPPLNGDEVTRTYGILYNFSKVKSGWVCIATLLYGTTGFEPAISNSK